MKHHHEAAAHLAKERILTQDAEVVAVFVGGSIAKGKERDDSDVDLIVIVPEANYEKRLSQNATAFLWRDVCDYENGYVEGKYFSISYLKEAAARGSEPTRHSFLGAFPIFCADAALLEVVQGIPRYPEHERNDRILSFLAQMQLNRWFFWAEGKRRNDIFLLSHAASQAVLFGCRLILAHSRVLFACQKRLIEQVHDIPDVPKGIDSLIRRILSEHSAEAKEAFCKTIIDYGGWNNVSATTVLARYQSDVESSWYRRVHDVAEW